MRAKLAQNIFGGAPAEKKIDSGLLSIKSR
jgi:hypothetical protein